MIAYQDARVAHAARIDQNHAAGGVWQDGKFRTLGAIGHGTRILTRDELRHAAPSIFADAAHARTSDRYSFLPTASILDGLEAEGWVPTLVQQQSVRDDTREGYQKHLIRFAHRDDIQSRSAERPEIVLVNAHDRSSAYHLHTGIFRGVCLNGLIICDATAHKVSITHTGFDPAKVIEASVEIAREVPRLMDGIQEMKAARLSEPARQAFAEAAAILRWDSIEKAPVSPAKLLATRRMDDAENTVWHTFNVIQENVIRGGQRDYTKRKPNGQRMPKTREVKGIDGNIALNKALWHLAETLKAHATA